MNCLVFAVVIAISGHARSVDNRPVRHVSEKAVGVIFQIFRLDERGLQPQPLGVGPYTVPFLYGVAAAKRRPAAAMHQLPANVEVLVDDEYRRPEVPCPDSRMQPHAA
jgi:hypothetical protein